MSDALPSKELAKLASDLQTALRRIAAEAYGCGSGSSREFHREAIESIAKIAGAALRAAEQSWQRHANEPDVTHKPGCMALEERHGQSAGFACTCGAAHEPPPALVTPEQAKVIAEFAHGMLHILDDYSEENAQTGECTVEIPAHENKDLVLLLEGLGDDPHAVMHRAIGAALDRDEPASAPPPADEHHELCDVNDRNAEGIVKPCNCKGRAPDKTAWLDSEEFYEAMQAYRHSHVVDQAFVTERFEAVKAFIRSALTKRHAPLMCSQCHGVQSTNTDGPCKHCGGSGFEPVRCPVCGVDHNKPYETYCVNPPAGTKCDVCKGKGTINGPAGLDAYPCPSCAT